jgi:hypothetical protein
MLHYNTIVQIFNKVTQHEECRFLASYNYREMFRTGHVVTETQLHGTIYLQHTKFPTEQIAAEASGSAGVETWRP